MPGIAIYLIYNYFKTDINALALFSSRVDISNLIAVFAFSMLGFLAAVITILFAFVESQAFIRYKRVGYLDAFFYFYGFTIFNLLITASLSFLSFSSIQLVWPFRLLLLSFSANMLQILYITGIIIKLAHDASREKTQ